MRRSTIVNFAPENHLTDNAVTETLFGSLKVERLHGMHRQAKDEVSIGFSFTITGGFTRRWDISAQWPSSKNGLPIKNGSPHNRSAKGDVK